MATKKVLTEQQQKFLDVLFEGADGNIIKAKKLAGYSEGYSTRLIVDALKEEIIARTQTYIAVNAPRAAMAVVGGIIDPTELGIKEKLNAAKDILDRSGLIKAEKMVIEATNGIMILPPKDKATD